MSERTQGHKKSPQESQQIPVNSSIQTAQLPLPQILPPLSPGSSGPSLVPDFDLPDSPLPGDLDEPIGSYFSALSRYPPRSQNSSRSRTPPRMNLVLGPLSQPDSSPHGCSTPRSGLPDLEYNLPSPSQTSPPAARLRRSPSPLPPLPESPNPGLLDPLDYRLEDIPLRPPTPNVLCDLYTLDITEPTEHYDQAQSIWDTQEAIDLAPSTYERVIEAMSDRNDHGQTEAVIPARTEDLSGPEYPERIYLPNGKSFRYAGQRIHIDNTFRTALADLEAHVRLLGLPTVKKYFILLHREKGMLYSERPEVRQWVAIVKERRRLHNSRYPGVKCQWLRKPLFNSIEEQQRAAQAYSDLQSRQQEEREHLKTLLVPANQRTGTNRTRDQERGRSILTSFDHRILREWGGARANKNCQFDTPVISAEPQIAPKRNASNFQSSIETSPTMKAKAWWIQDQAKETEVEEENEDVDYLDLDAEYDPNDFGDGATRIGAIQQEIRRLHEDMEIGKEGLVAIQVAGLEKVLTEETEKFNQEQIAKAIARSLEEQ